MVNMTPYVMDMMAVANCSVRMSLLTGMRKWLGQAGA